MELTKEQQEIYDRGVQDGFNIAGAKVLEALGIDPEKIFEEEKKETEEFLNKP